MHFSRSIVGEEWKVERHQRKTNTELIEGKKLKAGPCKGTPRRRSSWRKKKVMVSSTFRFSTRSRARFASPPLSIFDDSEQIILPIS